MKYRRRNNNNNNNNALITNAYKGSTVILIDKAEYQYSIDESANNNFSLINTNLDNSFQKQLEKDLRVSNIMISNRWNTQT